MSALDRIVGLPPAKLALAVRTLRDRAGGIEVLNAEPIAIIGMGCRFPGGADSPQAFWDLLAGGTDAITEVPADRWDLGAVYDPDPDAPGRTTSRWGGFLSGIDGFDPAFFGIAPREADSLDPQQRLVLEVAWEALERAGQPPRSLAGSATGIFLGTATLEYGETRKDRLRIDPYFGTGNNASVAAGRLSYLLGLNGPALAVDTACSASLTAVHLACQSLRAGESDMALAGGVNIILSPDGAIYFSKLGAMAADGRCKSFDAAADGYVRSEGCGMVVLKTLSKALADGDPVLALIRGSAINQDGRSNGLTAPNGRAQEAVIRRALEVSGVAAGDVAYVECHGTGTPLGDPIETGALARAYRADGAGPLLLGAVKSNLGHLEAAAGIAGLIKAVLCLQRAEVPPNLHFNRPNPHIDWAGGALDVPTAMTAWPGRGRRFAAVSAFGFSGSNAHMVLEEGMEPAPAGVSPDLSALLLLSAQSREALVESIGTWRDWLRAQDPARDAHAIAATQAQRRSRHPWRLVVGGRTVADLSASLSTALAPVKAEEGVRLVMVFPGQGSQYAGMGRELAAALPVVRETLAACELAFTPHVSWRLSDLLDLDAASFDALPADRVQPALFALQLALARQFLAWGLNVDAVIGHSMGEVAAACTAGALSLDDAARIICTRSRLVAERAAGGAMAVLEMAEAEALDAIRPHGDALSLAAINGPRSVLVAGRSDAVAALVASLDAAGIFARQVKVDYASHSAQMDPVLAPLTRALAGVTPMTSTIPLHSTVTGGVMAGDRLDAGYWADNLRRPVRLWPVVERLAAEGPTIFLEVSPHPVLVPGLEEGLAGLGHPIRLTGTLRRGEEEVAHLLATLGRLAGWGAEPDWVALQGRHPVVPDLPTHPWIRTRHWLAAAERGGGVALSVADHALLGGAVDQPGPDQAWRGSLSVRALPWLADHKVGGAMVLPGTAYLDMALAAAGGGAVTDIALKRLLLVPGDDVVPLHSTVRWDADGGGRLSIHARGDGGWALHAQATLSAVPAPARPDQVLARIAARCPLLLDAGGYYVAAAGTGVELGSRFRVLSDIRTGAGEVLARLSPAPAIAAGYGHRIHPALLDGGLQALAIAVLRGRDGGAPHVPVAVDSLSAAGSMEDAAWVHATARPGGDDPVGDVALLDDAGRVLVALEGVRFRRLEDGADVELANWLYRLDWSPLPPPGAARRPGNWLLVGGGDVAMALAAALTRAGCTVRRAVDGVDADPTGLAGIVHLSALADTDDIADLSPAGLMAAQAAGVGSLAALCRALAGVEGEGPRLWTLFPAGPRHAAMAGLARTAMQELPGHRPGFIELDGAVDAGALACLLLADGPERQVRLAGSQAFGARLKPLDRDDAAALAHQAPLSGGIKGAVLVTGGFGGIGLVLAEALADAGARALVLAGRRGPDAAGVARLATLRARGVTVQEAALDVTDAAAVAALVATYPIRGVIHAAGTLDDVPLSAMGPDRLDRVLAPKLAGAWALHRALAGRELDFVIHMSSTAALFGGPAQGNYAAANAFLDAMAAWQRGQGVPALSVGWSAWTEVGLAAASAGRGERLAAQGIGGIDPARGATILRRLLARPAGGMPAALTVLPLDVPRWRDAYPEVAADPLFADLLAGGGAVQAEGTARDVLPPSGPARRAALVRSVIAHVAAVTGRDAADIDARTALAGLGIDSLMAMGVRNRLQRDYGLALSATLLWRHPNPGALADHLAGLLEGDAVVPAEVVAPPSASVEEDFDDLSTAELARLLAAELEQDFAENARP
ncbi:type I polyketide synthase [Niveispirillum sp. KHB5.9]|uniref:type I polyketide synthase n=1 Tax=Niveispirillum sp. KHB5.9 TaxID=3400269 RepID=UPI003A8A4D6E